MRHPLFLLTLPLATVFSLTYFAVAKAQITPNNTLGAENSRVTQDVIKGIPSDRIDGGAIRGRNLFHSFQEFNINAGRGAYFSNPQGIANIFTRVTGDNVSNIQGIFGVLGKANLFFINPNGIIFGPNARLDVGGSFLGSTANSLIFENGFEFSATNPQAPPLLTITAPVGLSYRENFKNITNQSRAVDNSGNLVGLTVPEGNSLALVGGNVNLDGGILLARGGRVELGGLSAAGTIGLNSDGSLSFPMGVQRADVSLTNGATVDVSSNGGGSIAVNARNLEMTGSYLQAGIGQGLGTVGTQAGDISVNATGAINLNNSQIANNVQSRANGQGGDVSISASSLRLEAGAQVDARTFGGGKGGNLRVDAQDVQLIGTSADGQFFSGLSASAQPNSTGDAGDLTIRTNTLLARDGAGVFTATFGAGKGGNLRVDAQDVRLIGTSANGQLISGLATDAQPNSTGDAGDLTIRTNTLLAQDGAGVFTGTFGAGKGGNLSIDAQNVQLIGTRANNPLGSGLATNAQPNSTGDAGDLTIRTNTLLVRDGAGVFSGTFGAGKGGNLSIDAQDVRLIGTSADGSSGSALAASAQPNSTGDAGDLTIRTNTLLVRDGARVSTRTFGGGKGGNLRVDAQDVQLIGTSADGSSGSVLGASAQPNSTGNAGDLTLRTNTLIVRNGAVVAVESLGTGTAGNLTVNARSIRLDNDGTLSVNTRSNSTNPNLEQATITLHSGDLILSRDSNITTNARGNNSIGGNINIDTDVLAAVENSNIRANSTNFRGGQVKINTQGLFRSSDSEITATGANSQLNGTVQINTPDIDPNRSLITLPTVTEVAPRLISSSCAAFTDVGGSNFTVTGRSGLPPSPDEPLTSDVVWSDTRLPVTTAQHQQKTHAAKPKPQPIAIIPATGWVFNDLGEVTLISSVSNFTSMNTPTNCP